MGLGAASCPLTIKVDGWPHLGIQPLGDVNFLYDLIESLSHGLLHQFKFLLARHSTTWILV
jgi:hypothetical protein